jgi:hypothetical protein
MRKAKTLEMIETANLKAIFSKGKRPHKGLGRSSAWAGAERAARMDLALEFQDNMYFDAMYKAVSPDYLALDRSNIYRQFIRFVSPPRVKPP